MRVRFKYEITGPSSEEIDPGDVGAASVEDLRVALMEVMADRVSVSIIPDSQDLADLWAEVEAHQ